MAMKIAIFHNFLDNIGGAEVVDLIMARELNADIYTTNIDREKIVKMGFDTKNIFSLGEIPLNAPFRQEAAYWKFRKLNLGKKYDFYIVAGDWAMSGALHNKPNFWYVFSPMREIWDLYRYTKKHAVPLWQKPIFDLWVGFRRFLIRQDAKKINDIVAISKNVQQRIKKYLNRPASIIYPPIETAKYSYQPHQNYWLSVNRLITHKRVDIQLKAFAQLPEDRLVIVGSYEKSPHFQRYAKYCQSIKPGNVEIKSWVSDQELIDLYAKCKGLIFTAKDEDFGLTPLEAMASGKPVIAPDEGGCRETIIDGQTGVLIDGINEDKLILAVEKLNAEISANPAKYKIACQKQAANFDTKAFIQKIRNHMEEKI